MRIVIAMALSLMVMVLCASTLQAQRSARRPATAATAGTKRPSSKAPSDSELASLKPDEGQVFMESVVDERPEVLSGPALTYPDLLRQAGVQGRVLVQAIIDTSGRTEPRSVRIIQSPNPGFDEPARDYVLGAMFRPARIHGRSVRVLVNLPIDYKIR